MAIEFFLQDLYMSSVSSISHVSLFEAGGRNRTCTKENLAGLDSYQNYPFSEALEFLVLSFLICKMRGIE